MVSIDYSRQEQILRGKDGEKKKIKYKVVHTVEFFLYLKMYRFSKLFAKLTLLMTIEWEMRRRIHVCSRGWQCLDIWTISKWLRTG